MLAGLEATDGQFGLQVMCIGHGMSNTIDDAIRRSTVAMRSRDALICGGRR